MHKGLLFDVQEKPFFCLQLDILHPSIAIPLHVPSLLVAKTPERKFEIRISSFGIYQQCQILQPRDELFDTRKRREGGLWWAILQLLAFLLCFLGLRETVLAMYPKCVWHEGCSIWSRTPWDHSQK